MLEPGAKDDFQDIWIDPNDSNRMIVTCDGGTQVTLTGGKTWSRFDNQTGVQFYRVDTDDQFPYNLYGNAQDLLIYKAPSASRWGGIPLHMTEFVGNGETSRAIPHPTDPEIVYSLSTGAFYGMAAHFTINNLKTGQNEVRSIWPEALFGTPATEFKYRFNWQAPFLVSPRCRMGRRGRHRPPGRTRHVLSEVAAPECLTGATGDLEAEPGSRSRRRPSHSQGEDPQSGPWDTPSDPGAPGISATSPSDPDVFPVGVRAQAWGAKHGLST